MDKSATAMVNAYISARRKGYSLYTFGTNSHHFSAIKRQSDAHAMYTGPTAYLLSASDWLVCVQVAFLPQIVSLLKFFHAFPTFGRPARAQTPPKPKCCPAGFPGSIRWLIRGSFSSNDATRRSCAIPLLSMYSTCLWFLTCLRRIASLVIPFTVSKVEVTGFINTISGSNKQITSSSETAGFAFSNQCFKPPGLLLYLYR
mmetsp:Transcript_36905/g.44481  ORF Transcript_36905/g.44481 Transcript_36905/m.44481 type:complete len:201 (-) Transcript_36905:375-977(-)